MTNWMTEQATKEGEWEPQIDLSCMIIFLDNGKKQCNEYGTIYAISSDFGDRMTIQHLD